MHKHRFRIFACAFLTAALMLSTVTGTGALGVSQSDIDALERQKEEISAQKEETAGKMEELEQQQADALDRKAVLDENNTLTIQQIELITEQIDLYDDLIADKEVELTEARELGYQGWEFEGGKVVANAENNRLQVFFDEIPSAELRQELKSRGFHWARSEGAWQRQLTDNAIYSASRVAAIQPKDGSDPLKIQPKRKPKTGPTR